eukprot:TRINITY_DN1186_c0_g2_i2.p1 TRINITY_DN1186_c0_g2~~TRINITY_DN1186_c0_g2_i2.p1  ORF type:complete len:283 (-),score=24.93 TRINITY_DN1186_c0_g2_i2:910-1758(-)
MRSRKWAAMRKSYDWPHQPGIADSNPQTSCHKSEDSQTPYHSDESARLTRSRKRTLLRGSIDWAGMPGMRADSVERELPAASNHNVTVSHEVLGENARQAARVVQRNKSFPAGLCMALPALESQRVCPQSQSNVRKEVSDAADELEPPPKRKRSTTKKRCGFAGLSDDLLAIIFSRLEPGDAFQTEGVCRNFREALKLDDLWMRICEQEWGRKWSSEEPMAAWLADLGGPRPLALLIACVNKLFNSAEGEQAEGEEADGVSLGLPEAKRLYSVFKHMARRLH